MTSALGFKSWLQHLKEIESLFNIIHTATAVIFGDSLELPKWLKSGAEQKKVIFFLAGGGDT